MDDSELLDRIQAMVEEEHQLRNAPPASPQENAARLRALEVQLDQCWDLLRQRRAAREFGEDPDTAQARTVKEVEGYMQ